MLKYSDCINVVYAAEMYSVNKNLQPPPPQKKKIPETGMLDFDRVLDRFKGIYLNGRIMLS